MRSYGARQAYLLGVQSMREPNAANPFTGDSSADILYAEKWAEGRLDALEICRKTRGKDHDGK